ncbi:hypothetical protein HRbin05_00698 [archaeon HR05]|jgi:hypothetical protein|nr:hypothetical protein HRbin05_00698 [archaeon HR05]
MRRRVRGGGRKKNDMHAKHYYISQHKISW